MQVNRRGNFSYSIRRHSLMYDITERISRDNNNVYVFALLLHDMTLRATSEDVAHSAIAPSIGSSHNIETPSTVNYTRYAQRES